MPDSKEKIDQNRDTPTQRERGREKENKRVKYSVERSR
jgi:hypothetical protein